MWMGLGFLFTTPNNEDPDTTNSDKAFFFHEYIRVSKWVGSIPGMTFCQA